MPAATQRMADAFAADIAANPSRLAHAAEAVARRSLDQRQRRWPALNPSGPVRSMRIGVVCPYSFEVPGGVQAHVVDLARALRRLGHEVDVLAPAAEDTPLPDFVRPTGRAVGIPTTARWRGCRSARCPTPRVRRWIREHDFDVLHLHEPTAPSLSLLALMLADGPIVATFHTSTPRSRTLSAFQAVLRPFLEKITARIAVSALARRVQVEHLGGDAVEIPNGVDVGFFAARASRCPAIPRDGRHGRVRRPVHRAAQGHAGAAGGDAAARAGNAGPAAAGGRAAADEDDAAPRRPGRARRPARAARPGRRRDQGQGVAQRGRVLRAEHRRRELRHRSSPRRCPRVQRWSRSDLDAFRRVLDDGRAGVLVPVGDPVALAAALRGLLADPVAACRAGRGRASRRVAAFDWSVVAGQVLRVYETGDRRGSAAGGRVRTAGMIWQAGDEGAWHDAGDHHSDRGDRV